MQENLKTTKYRDGTNIINVTDSVTWVNLASNAYCDYNNTVSNSYIYGKLYNWYAVADTNNICPTGWHVPSDAEWTQLTDYLGGTGVGGKMKEAGTTHWNSPNTGADNSSGFTALPGGYRNSSSQFYYIASSGDWWSATESNLLAAWPRYIINTSVNVYRQAYNKKWGCSVRCLKD